MNRANCCSPLNSLKREAATAFTREWYNHPVEVIVKNPDILSGTPVFRGTRVPAGRRRNTRRLSLEGFPTVSRESAVAALEEAKQHLLARP
jgi:uncharacterized protein (DUF433 family)